MEKKRLYTSVAIGFLGRYTMLMDCRLRKIVIARIERELSARKWTQVNLAHRSGISQGHINNILSGKRRLYDEQIERIATAFGIPVDSFITESVSYPGHLPIIIDQYVNDRDFRMICDAAYILLTRFFGENKKTEEGMP